MVHVIGYIFGCIPIDVYILLVHRMYLCALDVKCTDPPTSTSCHWPKKNRGQTYANCHRYDQSIVNVLAVNRWNFDVPAYHVNVRWFRVLRRKSTTPDVIRKCVDGDI